LIPAASTVPPAIGDRDVAHLSRRRRPANQHGAGNAVRLPLGDRIDAVVIVAHTPEYASASAGSSELSMHP
jgi:hypothetical protein